MFLDEDIGSAKSCSFYYTSLLAFGDKFSIYKYTLKILELVSLSLPSVFGAEGVEGVGKSYSKWPIPGTVFLDHENLWVKIFFFFLACFCCYYYLLNVVCVWNVKFQNSKNLTLAHQLGEQRRTAKPFILPPFWPNHKIFNHRNNYSDNKWEWETC